METVRGLAADTVWGDGASAAGATVGSSFQHAVNLESDAGLLTLVTASRRRAPGALVTDARSFPQVRVGTEVDVHNAVVRVGPLRVDLAGCVAFSCRCAPVGAVRTDSGSLRAAVSEHAVQGSFLLSQTPSPFERVVQDRLLGAAHRYQEVLGAALEGAPSGPLGSAVGALVGLGAGLTPSGDDYLVGSLAVLHHTGAHPAVLRELSETVDQSVERTTTVSAHFLRAAAQGRFHVDIADAALAALTTPTQVLSAVRRVSLIGSTSGTDALYGLSQTLNTCVRVPSLF